MAKVIFVYEGISTEIQCSKDDKIKDICNIFNNYVNLKSTVSYLYDGCKLDLELPFKEYLKNNNIMKILVIKNPEEQILDISKFDIINKIISSIKEQNDYLDELKQ